MGPPVRAAEFAERAVRAHAAMERAFRRADGMYRRDGVIGRLCAVAHLWPFARALAGTLDLAGIDPGLLRAREPDPPGPAGAARGAGLATSAAVDAIVPVLERYWDARAGFPPAYASDPPGSRFGGDRYYDDNAWVALALIQCHRLAADRGAPDLARIAALWEFAQGGWDPAGGGVFWVEQGRGVGRRNHDRNAVTCAPNAEVGLHLADLGVAVPAAVSPEELFGWVAQRLDAGGDGLGPFHDKLRGDGTVDRSIWSYNQGSMIGAAVLLARRAASTGDTAGATAWAERAEAIARRALAHFGEAGLRAQPAEFNAIFFRNLLLLHDASDDDGLREQITATITGYADWLWSECRTEDDRFRDGRRGFTLLGQSAAVQIYSLLAWDPDAYRLLA